MIERHLGERIDNTFIIHEQLGKGKGGGVVYRVTSITDPRSPALALKYPASDTELEALRRIQEKAPNCLGVPRLLSYGHHQYKKYTVTQILGSSLTTLFSRIEHMQLEEKWNVVRMVGRMLVRRLEAVHRGGFVHGDVAPDNVLFGYTDEGAIGLFLIDFGCARPFPGGEAVKEFWNTVDFTSIRIVDGSCREPYDDLESLGYVLCHGLFGDLPWFQWTRGRWNWEETRSKDCERVRQVKQTMLRGEWCSLGLHWIHLMRMPTELTKILARCFYRPKGENGLPDYQTLLQLLGEGEPGGKSLNTDIADVATLTLCAADYVKGCYSAGYKLPVEEFCSHFPPAEAPAPERERAPRPEPRDLGPKQTESSLFDFGDLDDPESGEAEAGRGRAASEAEPPDAGRPADPDGAEHPEPAVPHGTPADSKQAAPPECSAGGSPRTRASLFDFHLLDEVAG